MKKIPVILLLVFAMQICLATLTKAQTRIDISKLALMIGARNTNARLYLGNNTNTAAAVLGNPSRIETEYWEMDDKTAVVWFYNENKLYFIDDALTSFELKDGAIAVGENYDTAFKVGDEMGTRNLREAAGTNRIPIDGEELPLYVDYFYGYNITKTPGVSRNIS